MFKMFREKGASLVNLIYMGIYQLKALAHKTGSSHDYSINYMRIRLNKTTRNNQRMPIIQLIFFLNSCERPVHILTK